jgi:hypothetical protein
MHAAPPGTLLFYAHRSIHSVMYSGRLRYASRFAMRRSRYGGTFYYDIVRARRTRQVDGIALIFFMGIGDYLMATPLIEELHLAHPDLPIYAYASSNADSVNSPLVYQLLCANPVFDRVFSFRGRPGWQWVDYDFRDALTNVPENFLILPVIYESVADISHRETALLETFGLPVKLPVRGPILHTSGDFTEPARVILSRIRQRIQASSARRVVCCHFGARSSGYVYPHIDQLARRRDQHHAERYDIAVEGAQGGTTSALHCQCQLADVANLGRSRHTQPGHARLSGPFRASVPVPEYLCDHAI